jgi:hypothetical protein
MTRLHYHQQLLRSTNTKTATIFVVCSTLLNALGAAIILGGTNHILFTTTVNVQLVCPDILPQAGWKYNLKRLQFIHTVDIYPIQYT